MSWKGIVGQENIKKYFQGIIEENRFANAYLFFGNEGVGKFAVALEVIKTASCLSPRKESGFIESCGECRNCKSILNLTFPNVEYVFSLPSGKATESEEVGTIASLPNKVIEEINEKLKEKILNPYKKFSIEGASQIRISQIRELRKAIALSNPYAGRKFIVIFNADEMRDVAQNAYLKTLEEPRIDITFFLLTTRRESLLPTIQSRCQPVFFPPLMDNDILDVLSQKYNKKADELQVIVKLANGSMTRAFELAESNLIEIGNALVDLLRIALQKNLNGKKLVEAINSLTQNVDKKTSQAYLQLLQNWFRDAFVISKNGSIDFVQNVDDIEALSRFAKKFGNKELKQVFEAIENCHYMINSNVQIPSAYLGLMLKIRSILL